MIEEHEHLAHEPELRGAGRRLARRLRRLVERDRTPAEALRAEYRRLERTLRRAGHERAPSQTVRRYLHTLTADEAGATRARLIVLYERARYAGPSGGLDWPDVEEIRRRAATAAPAASLTPAAHAAVTPDANGTLTDRPPDGHIPKPGRRAASRCCARRNGRRPAPDRSSQATGRSSMSPASSRADRGPSTGAQAVAPADIPIGTTPLGAVSSPAERRRLGREARRALPRGDHARWQPAADLPTGSSRPPRRRP